MTQSDEAEGPPEQVSRLSREDERADERRKPGRGRRRRRPPRWRLRARGRLSVHRVRGGRRRRRTRPRNRGAPSLPATTSIRALPDCILRRGFSVHAGQARSHSASAHRPRLSSAVNAGDDPGAAEISRGSDAATATPRYVGSRERAPNPADIASGRSRPRSRARPARAGRDLVARRVHRHRAHRGQQGGARPDGAGDDAAARVAPTVAVGHGARRLRGGSPAGALDHPAGRDRGRHGAPGRLVLCRRVLRRDRRSWGSRGRSR